MSKPHPIFERAMAPFLKPVATRNGPIEQMPKDERAYGEWCRKPTACKGKGYCPLDPACCD